MGPMSGRASKVGVRPGLPGFSKAAVERAALDMMSTIDPKRYVGHKHHVVPRFVLERFANTKGQVLVRDRVSGSKRVSNIKDIAVSDFYTFVDQDGQLDSSFEHLFGVVEGLAADVLRIHLGNPFVRPRALDPLEKHTLDGFVALQYVRGPRPRRSLELIADYSIKLVNQATPGIDDIHAYEFAPHQNEQLRLLADMVEQVELLLSTRRACVVTLDKPMLVTCDEPVCVESRCPPSSPASKPRAGDLVSVDGVEIDPRNLIHFQGDRGVGLANAEQISLPLGPRHALVYDRPGTAGPIEPIRLTGRDAEEFADDIFDMCVRQSIGWVAGHPDHPYLESAQMSAPDPIFTINDGGSELARRSQASARRSPRRLTKPLQT